MFCPILLSTIPYDRLHFEGGADLTPSYLYEEDAMHFHNVLKVSKTLNTSLF